MTKKAIILHGTGSGPDDFWLPWLGRELAAQGYHVTAPQLPEKDTPRLDVWTPFALAHLSFDKDTVLIGHSAGCPLILDVLQRIDTPIAKAVLVAGFATPIPHMPGDHPMLLQNRDWTKMRNNCRDFIFIHADNDPWGCLPPQGEYMRGKLGGTLMVMSGHGHFGSNIFKEPYPAFPMLLGAVTIDTQKPAAS